MLKISEKALSALSGIGGRGVYVFYGPKGVGKCLAAREVAKRILQTEAIESHPDFYYMGASVSKAGVLGIGIDDLAEFKRFSVLLPAKATVKVAIIDDAQTMSDSAQNSLLKLLEDGTEQMVVIMVTSMPLLDTIESRSKKCVFEPLSEKQMHEALPDAQDLILELANGRIGIYKEICTMPEYQKQVTAFLKALSDGDKKGLFSSLGLLKEKDKNNFFESYDTHLIEVFLIYIRNYFKNMLIERFEVQQLKCNIGTVALIKLSNDCSTAISLIRRKSFNKNDFFDFIRGIADVVEPTA